MYLLSFHVAISLATVLAGGVVVQGVLAKQQRRVWTLAFLGLMAVTCASGLGLPKPGFTPAVGTALVALCTTGLAAFACYVKRLSGRWMTTFVISAVLLQYFNVLVLVAQAFKHVGLLHTLAPAGNEPLVNATQAVVLVTFIAIGARAARRFRSMPGSVVVGATQFKDNAVDIAGGR
jgi:hypothetical protein